MGCSKGPPVSILEITYELIGLLAENLRLFLNLSSTGS